MIQHVLVRGTNLIKAVAKALKWPKKDVDFIMGFEGRRCKTCKFYKEKDNSCDILTYKVSPDGYCDGWKVKKGMESGFMNTDPSSRAEEIIRTAPHSDKATPRYYDNITGVDCRTCKYYVDPTWCSIVKGEISYICCCDAWDDGGRLGLKMAPDLIEEEKQQFKAIIAKHGKATHYKP